MMTLFTGCEDYMPHPRFPIEEAFDLMLPEVERDFDDRANPMLDFLSTLSRAVQLNYHRALGTAHRVGGDTAQIELNWQPELKILRLGVI